jgi:hypothetical protein
MSLRTSYLRFLTLRPRVRRDGDAVVVSTGFLPGLCSLFLSTNKAEFRPSQELVLLSYRRGYFFHTSRHLPFADVWYVDLSFGSMGTDWGLDGGGYGRHDQVESFKVHLVTRDERRHFVCAFRGEGAANTGWSGVLLGGDDVWDLSGTQESESRTFARNLAKLLGVSVGKPLDDSIEMADCPGCGRATSPNRPTCLYCGADLACRPSNTLPNA